MAGSGRLELKNVLEGLDIRYLTSSGLWNILNHYRETGQKSTVIKIWMIVIVIAYGPLLGATVAGSYFIEKNLEGITLILLNPLTLMQMALKFSVIWSGIEVQSRLLDLMKKDFLTCIPTNKRIQCDEIVRKFVNLANVMVKVGITMNMTTSGVWDLLPVLRSGFSRDTLGITIFGTPEGPNKIMGVIYPTIDFNKPYRTEAVYCYELFISLSAAFMISICEALLIQVLALEVAHIKVIAFLMKEIKSTRYQKGDTEKFLSYVREHQKLLKFGDNIQDLYNSLITLQLSTGLLILILAIFNASLGVPNQLKKLSYHFSPTAYPNLVQIEQGSDKGDIIETMKFASYTLYTLAEVFIYCYLGGEMETTSEEVCFAAYCSEWYAMKVEYRKSVLMTMMRSQRPIVLKAGKLVPVNMEAFKSIIQTAYSTSMLMIRVTNGETGL